MRGARGVLINITGGPDMTLFEVDESANRIKEEVDPDANIIVGSTLDESLEGEMRVSVVATGIEVRPSAAGGVTTDASAGKTSAMSMPSFRLRQAPGKPAAATAATSKAAPAQAPAAHAERAARAPREPVTAMAYDRGMPLDPAAKPKSEPVGVAAGQVRERDAAEPGFWHPPLPPQERFQEWGKLRAPVRGADRSPSLFERVTASFARGRERIDDVPGSPQAGAEAKESRLATVEDDAYDIPAFLRR
jgi:cell division protein FtsZ